MPQYTPIDSSTNTPINFSQDDEVQGFVINPHAMYPSELVNTERAFGIEELEKHDRGLREGIDQEELRGINQSGIGQISNAALRFIPSVAIKIADGAASVGGLIYKGIEAATTDKELTWSNLFDNDISNLLRNYEETLEENLGIHGSKKYREGNLAQKMFTTSFWTQDFADGLEFLASALVPGVAFGKIGSASKALAKSKYAFANKLGKVAENTKKLIGAGDISNATGIALGSIYSTVSESMVEALAVKKSILDSGGTEEAAALAARNTFAINMMALTIPNFLQQKWALGKYSGKELTGIASTKGFTKESFKPSYKKAITKGVVSEGLWEENIQSATEEFETNVALGKHKEEESIIGSMFAGLRGFGAALPSIASFNLIDTAYPAGSPEDRQGTAAMLGGLLGGPMSARAEHARKKAQKSKYEELVERGEKTAAFIELAEQQFIDDVASIYKQYGENEDGTPNYLGPEGKLTVDKDKLSMFLRNANAQHVLQEEALNALAKGDDVHYESVRQKALALLGYKLAAVADREELSDEDINYLIDSRLESLATLENKDAKEKSGAKGFGLGSESAKQLQIDKALAENKAALIENIKLYRDTADEFNKLEDFEDSKDNQRFNNRMIKAAFYAKSMIKTLNNSISRQLNADTLTPEELEKQSKNNETVSEMIRSYEAILADLKKNRDKYKKQYIQDVQPYTQLQKKISELEKDYFSSPTAEKAAELDLLEYQKQEYEGIEGTEEIKYSSEDLASSLPGQIVSPNLVPGQTPSQTSSRVPLKYAEDFQKGNTIIEASNIETSEEMGYSEITSTIGQLTALKNQGGLLMSPVKAHLDNLRKAIKNNLVKANKTFDILEELVHEGDIDESNWIWLEENGIGTEQEIRDASQDYYDNAEDLRDNLENAEYAIESLEKEFEENGKTQVVSRDQYVIRFANNTLEAVKQIFSRGAIKTSDGKYVIDETFEDIPGNIKSKLNLVRLMIKRFDLRKDLADTKELQEFKAQLKLYEEILDKLLILLEQKAVKRDQMQKTFISFKGAAMQEIFSSALKPIIGEELTKQILEAAEQSEFPYIYLEAYYAKIVSNFTVEQKKELLNNIKAYKKAKVGEIASLAGLATSNASVHNYSANPYAQRLVTVILPIINSIEGPDFNLKEFEEFKRHVDFFFFKSSLESTKYANAKNKIELEQALEKFTALHNAVTEAHQAMITLTSKFDLKKHVEKQIESVNKGEKTPTLQQNYVIRRVLTSLMQPFRAATSDSAFRNTYFLQGFIGTGKTVIGLSEIYTALINFGKTKSEEIIVTGHSNVTSNNLNKALKGKDEVIDINKIASGEISLEGKKFLIIDEGAALENEVLSQIVDHANKHRVKVLLVGDFTQNIMSSAPISLTDLYINSIDTLSVIYRTSVPAVSNASLAFKGKLDDVTDVSLTANKSIDEIKVNNNNLLGAVKASIDDIIEVLSKPSNAKRVLIVTNNTEVTKYRGKVDPSVKVVNYIDAQGTEFDEAYVIIEENLKHPKFDVTLSPQMYNSSMYTSIGRASKFTMFYAPKVTTQNTKSNELEASNKELTEDFAKIGESHRTSLEISKDVLAINTTITNTTKTEESKDDPKTPEEDSPQTQDDIDGVVIEDEVPGEVTNDSENQPNLPVVNTPLTTIETNPENGTIHHKLEFPSNVFLREGRGSEDNKNIDLSTAYIVKDSITGNLLVVAKHKTQERVYVLAVLGTEEINETSELQPYIDAAPSMQIGSYNRSVPLPHNKLSNPIKIANTQKLTIHTSGKLESFNPLQDILNFFSTFFRGARGKKNLTPVTDLYNTDGSINWSKIKDVGKVVIFTDKSISRLPRNSFKPSAGQPMLVLSNIEWDTANGQSTSKNPIMIPLKAKKYSDGMNIPYMDNWMKTIRDTKDSLEKAINTLNNLTSSDSWVLNDTEVQNGKPVEGKFNRLVKKFAKTFYSAKDGQITRNNIPIKDFFSTELGITVDEKVAAELEMYLDVAIKNIYGTTKVRTVQKLKEVQGKSYQPVKFADRQKLANKEELSPDTDVYITYLDSDDKLQYEIQEVLAVNKGPAQKALNAIASANSKKEFAIEAEHYVSKKKFFKSRNILSNVSFGKNQYGHLRELWRTGRPKVRSLMSIVPGIKNAIDAGLWDPEPWIQEDGRHLNIAIGPNRRGDIIFFDSQTPQAIIRIVEHVKQHVEHHGLNYLGNYFQSVEEANKWVEETTKAYNEVMQSGIREGLKMKDLNSVAKGEDLNLPLFKSIVPTEKISSQQRTSENSIDTLGSDLSSESNRGKLGNMLESDFSGVTPTSITIELPKLTPPEQPSPKNTTDKTPEYAQPIIDLMDILNTDDIDFITSYLEASGITDLNDLESIQFLVESLQADQATTETTTETTEEELKEDLSNAEIVPDPPAEISEDKQEEEAKDINTIIEEELNEDELISLEEELDKEVEEELDIDERAITDITSSIEEGLGTTERINPEELAERKNRVIAKVKEALTKNIKEVGFKLTKAKTKLEKFINRIKRLLVVSLITLSAGSGLFFKGDAIADALSSTKLEVLLSKLNPAQKQYLMEGFKEKKVDLKEDQISNTEAVLLLAENLIGNREKGNTQSRKYGSRNLGFTDASFEKAMRQSGFVKGSPWCNIFIKALFTARATPEALESIQALFTPSTLTTFSRIERAKDPNFKVVGKKDLKAGSIVYYGDRKTWKGHVVLVTKVNEDGSFETIEGNVGDKGEREGYKVGNRTRTLYKEGMKFLGIVNPNYDNIVNPVYSFITRYEVNYMNNTYSLSPVKKTSILNISKTNLKNIPLDNTTVSPKEFKCKE